jgi:hypothetical protein
MQRSVTRLAWLGVIVLSAAWVAVLRWRLEAEGYDGLLVWPIWAMGGAPAAMALAVLFVPALRASRFTGRVGACTAVALVGVTVYAAVADLSGETQSCFGPPGACDEVFGR